ncbi:MAG: dTDP-4-dehydrorhamnose 3,5-epimerase family protein [Chthoniobacterales bacterium]
MTFTETPLRGAYLIDLEPHQDSRGFFARSFCRREFEAHGLDADIAQRNFSFNKKAGTLRGMHFQKPPASESKLVRCLRGRIQDVIVDLRPESATYRQHFAVELNDESYRALFVPECFAHGFQSLVDDTLVEYQMSEYYAPELGSGFRYDESAFAIIWPLPVATISEQDLAWPAFST